nr:hypothetical protein 7 [Gammaproteobacteria bacterium]
MAKPIHGIRITKDTALKGEPVKEGDELFVPADISEDEARDLLRMKNRAEEIAAPKPEPKQPDPGAEEQPAEDSRDELLKLLDKTVPEITAAIQARNAEGNPAISDDQLGVLLKAEEDGNTRVGVTRAFEEEMKVRGIKKDGLFKRLFGNS